MRNTKDGDRCYCPRCTDGSGCSYFEPAFENGGDLGETRKSCHNCKLNDPGYPAGCVLCSQYFYDES